MSDDILNKDIFEEDESDFASIEDGFEDMEANDRLFAQTDEGTQTLKRKEIGFAGGPWHKGDLDETMLIIMGPQHPSPQCSFQVMK